jgi:hypothetical protein
MIRLALVLCVPAAALMAGCASESRLTTSGPTPGWVESAPGPTEGQVYFVGVSLGKNVLDQKEMRARALMDARRQIAGAIRTDVLAVARERLGERGRAAHGRDETVEAAYESLVATRTQEAIHGVRERDAYWEKWRVDPGLLRRAFTRYKYFVLAAYPKSEWERNVGYLARLLAVRQQARELMDAGRHAEAAQRLEGVLSDHPQAPLAIRLGLAEAYEKLRRPADARRVLEHAAQMAEGPAEKSLIDERLERLADVWPDLGGAKFVVVIAIDAGTRPALGVVRTVAEDALASSGARLVKLMTGTGDPTLPAPLARAHGAQYIAALTCTRLPDRGRVDTYHLAMYEARIQCTVRLLKAADQTPVAARSLVGRALDRIPDQALARAARAACRNALRDALGALPPPDR